jgi:type IV pilus assembly protein PilE
MTPAACTRATGSRRGYTLLDVMICAAIVASLSAIALPSYHRTMQKSHRAVARTALVDLAGRQEDHRRAHRAFAPTVGNLVGPVEAAQDSVRYLGTNGGWTDRPERDSAYRIEILDAGAPAAGAVCGPALTAAPVAVSAFAIGPQSGDRACQRLILCFAGRPGAKAAFDDQARATPAGRDPCWGVRAG